MRDSEVPTVYMAGQIQHSDDHGVGWRDYVKDTYWQFDWHDPLDAYNAEEDMEREWTDDDIVVKDIEMIGESDALLVGWNIGGVHFDGHVWAEPLPTAGTPMETYHTWLMNQLGPQMENLRQTIRQLEQQGLQIALPDRVKTSIFAFDSPKPIVVVYPGDRLSPWMNVHGDVVVEDFGEAIDALDALLSGEPYEGRDAVDHDEINEQIDEVSA